MEQAVLEAIRNHPQSDPWEVSILGFQVASGFMVQIVAPPMGLVGAWFFDGPDDPVSQIISEGLLEP